MEVMENRDMFYFYLRQEDKRTFPRYFFVADKYLYVYAQKKV